MIEANKRKLRNDIIFIAGLLICVAFVGLCFYLFRDEGNAVIVTVDGQEYGVFSLSEDYTEDIRTGDNAENLNRLVIRDGKAYVETASCPDGICSAHKPVSRQGESIVCLPHKVVITVYKTDTTDAPDIIV